MFDLEDSIIELLQTFGGDHPVVMALSDQNFTDCLDGAG